MEWATLLYAVLPIVASLVTLFITQRYERRRAFEDRKHALKRMELEQRHATAVRLFDQRFETYDNVLQRAQDAIEAAALYNREADAAKGAAGLLGDVIQRKGEAKEREEQAKEKLDEAKGALVQSQRALLLELDRSLLLASRPIRDEIRAFRSAVFDAKKQLETPSDTLMGIIPFDPKWLAAVGKLGKTSTSRGEKLSPK